MGDDLDDFELPEYQQNDDGEQSEAGRVKRGKKRSEPKTVELDTTSKADEDGKKKKKKRKKASDINAAKEEEKAIVGEGGDGPSAEAIAGAFNSLYKKELAKDVEAAELESGTKLSPANLVLYPAAASPSACDAALPSFLAKHIYPAGDSGAQAVGKGRPHCVVVSASALRCCALVPLLRKANKRAGDKSGGTVAKLFAKHQKVSEQAKELGAFSTGRCRIVVGTPNRLRKLLDFPSEGGGSTALSLEECGLLVLDAKSKDSKGFTLLTLPGVARDLMALFRAHVLPALEKCDQSSHKGTDKKKLTRRLRVVVF